ncbi:glucan endo-1,3-beta-glucosidase-like [Dioscorea cayenensis subsp. rotundata]|uniref:Glucan endo-1,3-beta-glucosidase-like n=1 Tax=Dioscorea cayennensis subsp. rotundata TaxID=55577 RepID=A0AB40AS69_DIOCR|nr:glucan endo-1,3-beta-glucosidase-like [Dioscorea cayenensis subsp. rotundata]
MECTHPSHHPIYPPSTKQKHAGSIGVNYGLNGDNLPIPATVVQLFNSHGIQKLRLFAPNNQVQQALEGTNIYVSLGVANDDLANLAGSQAAANEWVGTNILPFNKTLYQYVTVGNEAIPGPNSQQVAPAMRNIKTALNSAGLSQIMVTTVIADTALSFSFPPSQEYAQFTAPGTVVHDHGLEYQNLFDAMVDAFYAAMENVGGGSVGIAVSETGWPNGGQSGITSPVLAETYNQKLIDHVKNNGTPKRPSYVMDVFVFAMFNENQKTPGVEQCFGLFLS